MIEKKYLQIFYRNNSDKNISNILKYFDITLKDFLVKRNKNNLIQTKNTITKKDIFKQNNIDFKIKVSKQNFLESSKKLIEFQKKYKIENPIIFLDDKGNLIPDLKSNLITSHSKIKRNKKNLYTNNDQIGILSEYNVLLLDLYTTALDYSNTLREFNQMKTEVLLESKKKKIIKNKTIKNKKVSNNITEPEKSLEIFSEVLYSDLIKLTNKKLLFLVLISQSFFISLLVSYIKLFNFTKIDNNISFKLFTRNKLLKTFQISRNTLWKSIFISILRNNDISQDDKFGIFLMIKKDSIELKKFITFVTNNFPKYDLKFTKDENELLDTSKVIILYMQNQLTPSQIRVKEDNMDDLSLDIVGSIYFDDMN